MSLECLETHRKCSPLLFRIATVREKQIFFKVWEKSGNSVSSQGSTKFVLNISEKSGNYNLVDHWVWEGNSLVVKEFSLQKILAKELICWFIAQAFALDGHLKSRQHVEEFFLSQGVATLIL